MPPLALKPSSTAMGALLLSTLLATTALASEATQAFPPIEVLDRVEHYAISARTKAQLDEQLAVHAERFDNPGNGSTRSRFEITRTLQQDRDQCELTTLKVQVTISTRLPIWEPLDIPKATRARWKQSLAMLRAHEAGHREHAVEAASKLRTTLVGLKPKHDCLTTNAAVALELQDILQRLNARDARYDARTWNGLRNDPLGERATGSTAKPRSQQPPHRVNRAVLDFFGH